MSRLHTTLGMLVLATIGVCRPCCAWLYDGGPPTISGAIVSETSQTVWASEPFMLSQDSWATGFGAATARAYGAADMGFNVYLSDTLIDVPAHALASGTILPSGAGYSYRYAYPQDPIELYGGQLYFLTFAPNSNNFTGSISWSYVPGAYYGQGTGDFGQSWSQLALPLSVRVDGYVAPEPDAFLVVIAGLLGLGVVRRTRVSRPGAGPEL